MEFLTEIAAFALKGLLLILFLALALAVLLASALRARRRRGRPQAGLKAVNLRERVERRRREARRLVRLNGADGAGRKSASGRGRENKKAAAARERERREALLRRRASGEFIPENLFVIGFNGNYGASGVKALRHLIDTLLDIAVPGDEIILKLRSAGGLVNAYGLCASELARLRGRQLRLTVCVDEVAASGGYLMACVADRIVAAPFAYIGSIGVIAALPNFHRLLNRCDVDYEQITAGKYKRTLTMFGRNTEEGREKFREELELIHRRFKEVVTRYRPALLERVDEIATGEYWLGRDALEQGLVDEIAPSSAYIARRVDETVGCALKLEWRGRSKKSILKRAGKFLTAGTWLRAARRELESPGESGIK